MADCPSEFRTQQARHEAFTLNHIARYMADQISGVRCGHSDAAHMCDAICADIEREHTVRGRVTKQGRDLSAAVRRAGDAIWAMREKVAPAAPRGKLAEVRGGV